MVVVVVAVVVEMVVVEMVVVGVVVEIGSAGGVCYRALCRLAVVLDMALLAQKCPMWADVGKALAATVLGTQGLAASSTAETASQLHHSEA